MDITDFTTYADVRSLCGVSVNEIPDAELGLSIYSVALELALDSVSLPDEAPGPGPLKTTFLTVAALAEGDRTDDQQKLYLLTKMFSAYSVAGQASKAISLNIAKSISDSEASITRFSSEATFKDIVKSIQDGQRNYKQKLEDILEDAVTSQTLLAVVSPETDRVTDE